MRPLLAFLFFAAAPVVFAQSAWNFTFVPYVDPASQQIEMAMRMQMFQRSNNPMIPGRGAAINSQFVLANGQPLEIGGYMRGMETFSRQQVPLLGSLPFVGGLFRNDAVWKEHRFDSYTVQATIVDPAGNPVYRQDDNPPGYRQILPGFTGLVMPPQKPAPKAPRPPQR